jgi:hypothetical protein
VVTPAWEAPQGCDWLRQGKAGCPARDRLGLLAPGIETRALVGRCLGLLRTITFLILLRESSCGSRLVPELGAAQLLVPSCRFMTARSRGHVNECPLGGRICSRGEKPKKKKSKFLFMELVRVPWRFSHLTLLFVEAAVEGISRGKPGRGRRMGWNL